MHPRIMKNSLLVVFLVISQHAISQLDSLKGPVKSIREKIIFLDSTRQNPKLFSTDGDYGHSGFLNGESTILKFYQNWYHSYWVHYVNYHRNFNRNGKPVSETWYDKKDRSFFNYYYQYDTAGMLIEKKSGYRDTNFLTEKLYYNYFNQLTSSFRYPYGIDGYLFTWHTLDSSGTITETKRYDRHGETSGVKFIYSPAGKMISKINHVPFVYIKEGNVWNPVRDEKGTDHKWEDFEYDDKGNLAKKITYAQEYTDQVKTVIQNEIRFEYNAKNEKIGEYYSYAGSKTGSYKRYYYYPDGKLKYAAHLISQDSIPTYEITYTYNKRNDIEQILYIDNGVPHVVKFSYEFDSHGNWIRQTKSLKDKVLYSWERAIEYY